MAGEGRQMATSQVADSDEAWQTAPMVIPVDKKKKHDDKDVFTHPNIKLLMLNSTQLIYFNIE